MLRTAIEVVVNGSQVKSQGHARIGYLVNVELDSVN